MAGRRPWPWHKRRGDSSSDLQARSAAAAAPFPSAGNLVTQRLLQAAGQPCSPELAPAVEPPCLPWRERGGRSRG